MNTKPISLDLISIASPCQVNWDEMRGDDRVRFCSHCRLSVYDLSELPRADAEKLVRERDGRLCVRFFRRTDGTVLTRDCPVGLREVRQRLVRSVAALAGLVLAMISGTAFGSRITRWLPSGFRAPKEALAEWVDPTPPARTCSPMMGKMMMGDVALPSPPVLTPPVPPVPAAGGQPESP